MLSNKMPNGTPNPIPIFALWDNPLWLGALREELDDAPAAKTVKALGEVPENTVSVVTACETGDFVDVVPADKVASRMSTNAQNFVWWDFLPEAVSEEVETGSKSVLCHLICTLKAFRPSPLARVIVRR
jgi:hypothetical protein